MASHKDGKFEDEMFSIRRPRPHELPAVKQLLLPLFTSGAMGRDLTFGNLEFEEYLDWFLPRALADPRALLHVMEFQPLSSFRTYPPQIVGCFYIQLDQPLGSIPDAMHLEMLKLRAYTAVEDIKVWPNMQAAEVHKRVMRCIKERDSIRAGVNSSRNGHVWLFFVQEQFRGTGIGSRMLSWASELAARSGVEELHFVGDSDGPPVAFARQCGFVAKDHQPTGRCTQLCVKYL